MADPVEDTVQALDPFAAAALRQRHAVQPPEGRQKGAITYALTKYLPHLLSNLAGLPQRAGEAAQHHLNTGEYDPAPAVETALLATGGRMPFAKAGELGVGGGKAIDPNAAALFKSWASKAPDAEVSALLKSLPGGEARQLLTILEGAGKEAVNIPITGKGSIETLPPGVQLVLGKHSQGKPLTPHEIAYLKETAPEMVPPSYAEGASYMPFSNVPPGKVWEPPTPIDPASLPSPGPYKPVHDWHQWTTGELPFRDLPSEAQWNIPKRGLEAGYNVPVHHGTKYRFDPSEGFKLPEEGPKGNVELGIHAGSPNATTSFIATLPMMKNHPELTAQVFPLALKAKNPLELPDAGLWNAHNVANSLRRYHSDKLSGKEATELSKIKESYYGGGTVPHETSIQQIKDIRGMLDQKGFDAVKYKNAIEDPGHTSYITWDPKNLRVPWAAFKDLNSTNLLAGVGGAAAMAPEVAEMVKALQPQAKENAP